MDSGFHIPHSGEYWVYDSEINVCGSFGTSSKLPTLKSTDETLDTALLALSTADLGRDRKDPVLLRSAALIYKTALVRLHNALGIHLKAKKLLTLITCLTLIQYQLIGEHPAKEHCMSHIKGVAELVRPREPSAYSEGIDNLILRSCRVNIILVALCALQRFWAQTNGDQYHRERHLKQTTTPWLIWWVFCLRF